MKILRKIFRLVFNKVFFQKIVAYTFLVLLFFIFQDFLLIFFLTFIFAYLFLTFWKFLKSKLDNFIEKIIRSYKLTIFLKNFFSLNIVVLFLYLVFIWALFIVLSDLIPKITDELTNLKDTYPIVKEQISMITSKLEEIKNLNSQIGWSISEILSKQDIAIVMQVFERLKTAWIILIQIVLSLILSYIFITDREKLASYLNWMKQSNFKFLYDEYKMLIDKIVKTFWLVFEAQSMIALANTIFTIIWLYIIWFIHWISFPFIYTLAIIVFICWFIPVLWTFISSFPILLIAYSWVGWWGAVAEVIVLITIIHAIEAYYLNPKIVSSYIHLPLSLTFIVLIISEHFMWFAWLIIGISSFYLFLELLKDTDKIISKSKKAFEDLNEIEKETKWNIKNDIRLSRKI